MSGTVTNLVFSGGATAATSAPSFVYSLPSYLDPNYTGSFNTSAGTIPLSGTANISAGLSGGITLTLGQYTPNIPVSINVALPSSVADGQVFTVDPTLVGATDASFSLMGPGATLNLDLGLNGQVSFHVNQGSLIGASLNLTVPLSFGYSLPAGKSVSIGPGSITVSEPTSGSGTSAPGTSLGSLPTLSSSVTSGNFLSASVDLIQTLAYFLPGGLGNLINGSASIGVGGVTYSLLSAPLSAALAISDTVTLTPGSIGVSIAEVDNGNTLQTQSGTLGTAFQFTAPSTGSGNLSLETTYTLNYQVSSVFGLVGNLSLTLNGPQASLTGFGSTIGSIGPLFTDQLFSYSAGLGTISTATLNQSLAQTQNYSIAYSDTPPICFLAGTRILTPTGEKPVQDIKIGDRVVTRFGGIQHVKWIGRQAFPAGSAHRDRDILPVRIHAGALGPLLPARDLFVSPGHSILIGDTLVLARSLVNGVTITQARDGAGPIDYFQIELDSHDCVIAEGTFSETYADGPGLRAWFHNEAEFWSLYPDHCPAEELTLCAPRPEKGAKLWAVTTPVIARAGEGLVHGALEGFIERAEGWQLAGWAMDATHRDLPVRLDIFLEDRLVATALAADYREDLYKAGLGRGACSFSLNLPVRLLPHTLASLSVRRHEDGAELPWLKKPETQEQGRQPVQLRLVA